MSSQSTGSAWHTRLLSLLLVSVLGCSSNRLTGPQTYLVAYHLTLDPGVTADSLKFLGADGLLASATSLGDGWSVSFSLHSGAAMQATAWLTASGAGTATLEATWTAEGTTHSATGHTTAAGPGAFTAQVPLLHLP